MESILLSITDPSANLSDILESLNKKQLHELVTILKHHYYFATALVPDSVYDVIEDFARSQGVKIRVGASGKTLVKLPFYLSSLDKIKTDEEIEKYFAKHQSEKKFVVMDKLNGVSGLYVCDKNMTTSLYTRGTFDHGQNISHLLEYLDLPKVKNLAVRGELIFTFDGWEKVKNKCPELKTALGAVVGTVNSQTIGDKEKYRISKLNFVVYEIVDYKGHQYRLSHQLQKLKKWGFKVVDWSTTSDVPTPSWLSNELTTRRSSNIYDIDGIVITSNIKYDRCDGETPSYSVAYKKLVEVKQTTITELRWKPSKSGKLCPVAYYEPVQLGGSTLNKTTVHNAKMVLEKGIGVGAVVEIELQIVPKIYRVIEPVEPILPDVKYKWDETQTHIYLVDSEGDSDVIINQINNFMTKIGVKNFGKGLITKCVNAGYDSIIKILSASIKDFSQIPTFKEITSNKIHTNIHTALKTAGLSQVMAGSNCFGETIGTRKLNPVIARFPNLVTEHINEEKLLTVPGCKQKTARRIYKGLKKFRKLWKDLSKFYTIPTEKVCDEETNQTFNRKTFVFSDIRDRALEAKIVKGGGRVTSTVSSKTTMLIVKTLTSETVKVTKAKKLGVSIILYDDFIRDL